jgi:hypothetical protein
MPAPGSPPKTQQLTDHQTIQPLLVIMAAMRARLDFYFGLDTRLEISRATGIPVGLSCLHVY